VVLTSPTRVWAAAGSIIASHNHAARLAVLRKPIRAILLSSNYFGQRRGRRKSA
jgi:hypothetical protein